MKKNVFQLTLLLALFSMIVFSCSDSIEPVDNIDIVNEENSTDDGDDSDDGNGGDDTNDDSGDSTDDDGNNDDSSGDDTNDDNTGNGDDMNNDDTSDDDSTNDDSSDSSATLVGSWRLVSATINDGEASTTFQGSPVTFSFTSTSQDEDVDITFQENPNVVQGVGQYTNVIQFTIFNIDFVEEATFDSPLTDGNWEMPNGNELIISDSSQANGTFTINELTANTLILQTDFEQTVPTDDLELDTTGVLVIELVRN
ncbi:MAG: lipocalin family protein [Bacteroidota bacterium]